MTQSESQGLTCYTPKQSISQEDFMEIDKKGSFQFLVIKYEHVLFNHLED